MNFWETVDSELQYQNKERKDLAKAAGFDVSNIGKGMKNGGVPLADTAVRIAQFLNVSVEYLVSGGKSIGSSNADNSADFKKFFYYRKLVSKIDSLPKKTKDAIIEMFEKI
jgi:transcriptional regulator with XRE-family HTH domain